jgi:sugar/nucleoside kinase (ribokinase family)
MSTPAPPAFVAVGSIFIDDIVYPDGRTDMGVLGGGGVHCAAGMAVWGERAGLVATWGLDMPEAAATRLQQDFDLRGIVQVAHPQVRAWQVFEWDGRRTELFRVDVVDPFMRAPTPDQLPDYFRQARAVTILRDGEDFRAWRAAFPEAVIFWEPEQAYMIPANSADFRRTLPQTHIVSPNLLEASLIYGTDNPDALISAMLGDGAAVVVLRMGEHGSLVATESERIAIPAVPVTQVVDVTGAGNTYCGAFLVGWQRTGHLRTAAQYGAVAASFTVEVVGVAPKPDAQERDQRLGALG